VAACQIFSLPIKARAERWKNKMAPDELNNIAVELKRLGSELNLPIRDFGGIDP